MVVSYFFVFLSIDEASFITYDLIMVVSWRYVLAYKKLESVIDIVFYKSCENEYNEDVYNKFPHFLF